ncbi:MAG: FemAB family XrtA/PEP-CTERM system-associated protein [Longimicrobiales bacterium]
MSTPVRVTTEASAPEAWHRILKEAEGATFCHLPGWRQVMEGTMGHEYLFLAARSEEGELLGGLPLVRMRSPFFGHHLVSVPFLNYGGPLGPAAVRKALAEAAKHLAEESGADRLVLRNRTALSVDLDQGRDKVMVRLELGDDPEALWTNCFPAKLRSQIRRPQKEGMTCRFGPDERHDFYRVFAENMRDLGTPVHSLRLFDALAEVFPEEVIFGVVYHGEEPVAGGCGFLWGGEFEMTWASALREYNRMAPNMLLYWSFMEKAIERGAALFNFGRCTPGGGTHRFKRQWGGEDTALAWLEWDRHGSGAPSADSWAYGAAMGVWRHLPLPLANRLGPFLSRRIPTF